jgi:DNA-binding LytR/AlgR family response regulator
MDHYLIFHFSDKKVMDRKSIKDFIGLFSDESFIQIHKSYLVNKAFISTVETNKIILENGQKLPISRTYKARVTG